MKRVLLLAVAGGLFVSACSDKMNEAAESLKNVQSIAESADEAQKTQTELEKRRDERRAKGDTIALPYAELQKYLPGEIAGYKAGELEGSNTEVPGYSVGSASREYTKEDGSFVRITLSDYNSSEMGWAAASTWMALKIKTDNSEEYMSTFQTDSPYINGMEKLGKKDKSATITYGLGGRFLLVVEANNQTDLATVKKVAESMDLKKLAAF